jgi:hypothetical protein
MHMTVSIFPFGHRQPILLAAAILLLARPAAPAGARGEPQLPDFSAQSIQAQIEYLASDALKGRGSGEPGNELAAQFIARTFRDAGLKPLGTSSERDPSAAMDGSGFYQPFRFIAGRAVGRSNALEVTVRAGRIGRPLQPVTRFAYRAGQDFEPSSVSGGGKANGRIVFVGYGIRAPRAQHDDYKGVDVRGAVALMLAGNPNQDPHSPLADYAGIRRKAVAARNLGALAVLVVPPANSDASGAPSNFDEATDAGLPVLRVRYNLARSWLARAHARSLEKLQAAADAGKPVSFVLPATCRLAADVRRVPKVTANVVGLLEGGDPALRGEYLVVGAHLDHLGMGGPGSLARSSAPAIHHGADDNASGAAGVMQLAAWFGRLPESQRPRRSIVFICFSGEELGLLGSSFYVSHPLEPLKSTVAMINMDMVGRLRDNKLIVIGSGTANEWSTLLTETNRLTRFQLARSESGFGASDQQSFYARGVPVLFFFTGTHPDYHTPTDTADKINSAGEAHVLQLVAECADEIADSPSRPTFKRITLQQPAGPARGFRVYFGSVPDYAATAEGVTLTGVREGSPAEKAGLKAGDVIVRFGDRAIKNVYDYTYALEDHRPGDVVKIVVKRAGQTVTLTGKLAARPE